LSQTDLKITKGVALKSNERAKNEKLKKTGKIDAKQRKKDVHRYRY
jgi:hypothetical protein